MENKNDGTRKLIQDFNALGWIEIIFGIILLILAFIIKDSVGQITLTMMCILRFLIAFLMFRGKKYAINRKRTAYTYGIITGILLILGLSLVSIILGILVLVHSNNYNIAISNDQNNS